MAIQIPRSVSEQLEDNIVAILKAKAIEQTLLDPENEFFVDRDRLLSLDPAVDSFPLVVVWLQSLQSENSRSSGKTYQQETATFAIDCYTIGDQDNIEGSADINGTKRFLYLIEQVKYTLLALINIDLGLPAGTLASKSWPDFQMYQPDVSHAENTLISGRWTFKVEYSFIPEELELLDLTLINVHTDMWDTIFTYPI